MIWKWVFEKIKYCSGDLKDRAIVLGFIKCSLAQLRSYFHISSTQFVCLVGCGNIPCPNCMSYMSCSRQNKMLWVKWMNILPKMQKWAFRKINYHVSHTLLFAAVLVIYIKQFYIFFSFPFSFFLPLFFRHLLFS